MGRRYTRDLLADRVETIKKMLPLAGIGADIITGFPGESAYDFDETYSFLENLPLSYLHVFTFSARPGTAAEDMPEKVGYEQKERRSKKLIKLSELKKNEFNTLNTGQTAEVLFEKIRSSGMITGFTGNYIRVEYQYQAKLSGQIIKVRLKGISPEGKMSVELID